MVLFYRELGKKTSDAHLQVYTKANYNLLIVWKTICSTCLEDYSIHLLFCFQTGTKMVTLSKRKTKEMTLTTPCTLMNLCD